MREEGVQKKPEESEAGKTGAWQDKTVLLKSGQLLHIQEVCQNILQDGKQRNCRVTRSF
jgi:hypothetical protein